jgi:chorismate mutase/prephenate dehydratase
MRRVAPGCNRRGFAAGRTIRYSSATRSAERMSTTAPLADPETPPLPSLAELRAELDGLDDALHDLLMRRAAVVERVAGLNAHGKVPFRPGREAAILRRLLARHTGRLPPRALVRLWRELFAATTSLQGQFSVTVSESDPAFAYTAAAREHFGALTPLRAHRSPAQAIGEVSGGAATAAVLPLPAEEEPLPAAWWTTLLHQDEPRLHVVARLPFWAPRPEGAPQVQALVVAAAPPDPSGADRALIGLELRPDLSRARLAAAFTGAGLAPAAILLRRDPQATHGLITVEGLLAEDDPRLAALGEMLERPTLLGGYAVPLEGEA